MYLIGRSLLIVGLILGVFASVPAQKRKPRKVIVRGNIATVSTAPAMPPDVQRRYGAFMQVWLTIRDKYFDPTFSSLNWDDIRTEYEPKVKAARSDAELHDILGVMIGRLNRSHLAIIPPEVYQAIEAVKKEVKAKERQYAKSPLEVDDAAPDADAGDENEIEPADPSAQFGIGVDLSLIGDRFVITRLDPNSAAEYSGLKRGYIIDKVNGVSLTDMLGRIQIYYAAISKTHVKQYIPAEVVAWMLNGARDTYVNVGYIDENEQAKEVRIRREPLKDKGVVIIPNFPQYPLSFESRSLNDSVGYIRFNMFAMPVNEKFCNAIGELKSKDGLIIDLRGNSGGVLASLPILAGMLTTTSIDLGTAVYRNTSEPLQAPSKAKNFRGKIVVLVNDSTASAAEMFAMALRENGRALIIGEHTAGEALPSVTVKLATGAVFQYPIANYRSSGGKYIEGSGIEPDVRISLDRKALLDGKDLQLDAALKMLADKSAFLNLKPVEKPGAESRGIGTGSGDAAPLPPPPVAKAKPDVLTRLPAAVEVVKRTFPPGHDEASRKYINDFLTAIGGKEGIKAISKYSVTGKIDVDLGGGSNTFVFKAFRDKPDKYAEITSVSSVGEVREVYDEKQHYLQTDAGLERDLPRIFTAADADLLTPIFELTAADELFPSLSFTGTFDRDGRKAAVIEGKTKDGTDVAFAFDVETKMLVNLTRSYRSTSFGDYRKVGDLFLPFLIERGYAAKVRLDTISVNQTIDPAIFTKKVSCFDRPD